MWGDHVFLYHDVIRRGPALVIKGPKPRCVMVDIKMGLNGITFRDRFNNKVTRTLSWERLYRLATRKEAPTAKRKKNARNDRNR